PRWIRVVAVDQAEPLAKGAFARPIRGRKLLVDDDNVRRIGAVSVREVPTLKYTHLHGAKQSGKNALVLDLGPSCRRGRIAIDLKPEDVCCRGQGEGGEGVDVLYAWDGRQALEHALVE